MDFEPTYEERDAAARSHAFVAEILPGLPPHPLDFALAAQAALGERGFFDESSTVRAVLSVSALASGSASLGAVAASGWLFAEALRRHGGASRAPLATAARSGTLIGCVAIAPSVRTTRTESGIRLAGNVPLVANGPLATHAIVVAGSEASGTVTLHLDEALLDPRRAPEPTGLGFKRLPRCALALDGLLLGDAATLTGAAGESLIGVGRLLTAALALGLAQRATARALSTVSEQDGRPPQNTEFLLADLATECEAASLSVLRAAWLRDTNAPHAIECAAGKLLATRTASRAVHAALGVTGEQGADSLRSAYLDARALEMQSGDDREQEDTMASVMLGER